MKPGIMSISILIQAVTTLICSLPGTTVNKKEVDQPVYQIHFVWQELEEYQLPALISCRI